MRQIPASKPIIKSNILKGSSKVMQGILPKTTVASASRGKRIAK